MSSLLSLSAALGTMKIIRDYASADLDSLGIQPTDLETLVGNAPWTVNDRRRVLATLDALMFGSLDKMGLPRVSLPAEFVAAVISVFVHPLNRFVCASWISESGRTQSYAAQALASHPGEGAGIERVTTQQIIGLLVLLEDGDTSTATRQGFQARMAERVRDIMDAA